MKRKVLLVTEAFRWMDKRVRAVKRESFQQTRAGLGDCFANVGSMGCDCGGVMQGAE
jgi:hypothetical protein